MFRQCFLMHERKNNLYAINRENKMNTYKRDLIVDFILFKESFTLILML